MLTETSTTRIHPAAGWTDGKKRDACRFCGGPVPKGRRTFCSGARARFRVVDGCWTIVSGGAGCVHEWLIRTQPQYARDVVRIRDQGVCACCRTDTEALATSIWALRDWPEMAIGALVALGYAAGDILVFHGRPSARAHLVEIPSLWQADHIVPVVEGGGGCGLDNLRTLCKPCHRRETAALAKRRAAARLAAPVPAGTPLKEAITQYLHDKAVLRGDVAIPPEPPDLTCEPPWKWVGGKRELLEQLQSRPDILPPRETIRRYHEPFVGGGALFFGRYAGVPAVLADTNRWLIVAYRMLRERTDRLLAELRVLVDAYNGWAELEHPAAGAFYLVQRARFHAPVMDPVARSAIFILLRMAGFNGLYRVNAKGRNNVSWNKRRRLRLDEQKFRAAARALQRADLLNFDFEKAVLDHVVLEGQRILMRGRFAAGPDDFVFLDPPYCPVSETANFTAYQAGGDWGPRGKDRQRLIALLHHLEEQRIRFLACDADTAETREIYAGFRLETVEMRRAVNRDGKGRGPVPELLILPRRSS